MNAIKTIDLCKQYGNKNVVNHLNITVPQGAIYGFIGRNGAGNRQLNNEEKSKKPLFGYETAAGAGSCHARRAGAVSAG